MWARLRGYDIQHLMKSSPFFLFQDGFVRKTVKSDLSREIKKILQNGIPETGSKDGSKTMIVFNFMAYSRKVPIKKLKLLTYGDMFNHLWNIFKAIGKEAARIDIIFDLYLERSIKEQERSRRGKTESVDVSISNWNQHIPIDVEKFWSSGSNKAQFQGKLIFQYCFKINFSYFICS